MTFGAPEWFLGLALLLPLILFIFLRNEMRREVLLKKLVAARLLPDLAASTSAARRRWKFGLALLGLAFVALALTQPRLGSEVIENHQRGLDLMLAVDTSKSMLSTDAQPDRLTRAKFAAQDLIDSLEGDRVGLIAFAGTSFVQAPLTVDYSAVEAALSDLDTNTIPRGGTNIASAIREAADAFGNGESSHQALVLFTDGEELEDNAVQAAKEVNGKFRIFTVGVGTPEGSLIPMPGAQGGTDFVKDAQGEYVKSKLDEEKLKEIANATGGFYIHLTNGPATAKAIIEQGLQKMQEHEFETRQTVAIERYEWPLAAGILFLIASMLIRERRRVVRAPAPALARREAPAMAAAVLLALALLIPVRGWATNQGVQLYDQKNYKGAYDVFQQQLQDNPASAGLEFDRGASAYKEGDYDKALESFGKVLGSQNQGLRGQAEYNLGNTMVERGALQQGKDEKVKEWTEALKHYDQALKVDPNNTDARYNENVVQKMIDDLNKKQPTPPPQQQQQQQQQQQKNQQNQQQNQQNQQQQNQQSQNQQQQGQQNQQQKNGGQGQQNQQNSQQQNQQAQNQQQQGQQQQNGGKSQQNSQQQNQQAQNQQQQGQQGQQRQQNGGQNQQNSQQNSQQQNQQAQNQQGGQGQQSQQQNGQQENHQSQASNSGQAGSTPSPTPGNGPGVLKEQSQNDQQADAQAAARGETEASRSGEMTPSQARALIDSLRGEDEHVSLYDKQHNSDEPVYKDW